MRIKTTTRASSAFFELEIEAKEVLRLSRLLAEFGPAAEEHCALLKYCELDTLAMVMLWQTWKHDHAEGSLN
jgi:hypothetical protein